MLCLIFQKLFFVQCADAAVNGGIANYERAFLTENYIQDNPEHKDLIDQLKNVIAEQIPLLEMGLK